jgi:hypothetical protein
MNKLLDDISKLQLQITNKKNLENIKTELKTLPQEYSKINKNTFNEFYDFENKYEKKNQSNIDIIFPEDSLEIQDMHRVDTINDEVDRIHTNIIKRNNIYNKAIENSNINEIHTKLTKTRVSSSFDLIGMIELYKRIDMKISDDNFDDEFCINKGNQLFGSFINYHYINNEVDKLKNIKKYNNELNTVFKRSLEVIEYYDIEKLIVNPTLNSIENVLKTNLILTDDFIDTLQHNSLILSYELTPELFLNLDKHIISNYDLLVDRINIQIDPNKLEKLLKRIDISTEYLSNIKSALVKKKIYCNSSPDLTFLSSELIQQINVLIKKIDSVVNDINKINKENISQYITLILSIKEEYGSIDKTIIEFDHIIDKIVDDYNEIYSTLSIKLEELRTKSYNDYPKLNTNIEEKFKELDNIQLTTFNKMQSLNEFIKDKYNKFLMQSSILYKYKKFIIELPNQYGGSDNQFNDYFNKLVDISINVGKNNDISEHKIRFNNLLFYSHVLYIVNYTNKERTITSHINRYDVKKYLKIITYILKSIKNNSKGDIIYYFFKYHYFNLKIVYDFLHKLNRLWTKPKTNMCNEEIIKLYDENRMNNNIYFNLLDIKYTPNMKKAIFIFFGMKVILDKLIT